MKTKGGLLLSVAAFLVVVILAGAAEKGSPWDKIGQPAAPLTGLQWIKGQPVTFQKGSVTVVEFWATWCPPCRESIPHLTKIQSRFKDKGVTIVGISTEAADVVRPFVDEKGETMGYTVAVDADRQVSKGYMGAFGMNGIPHAFIVGKEGNVIWHGHPMAGMDAVLEKILAGQFDPAAYARQKAVEEKDYARLAQLYRDYFAAIRSGGKDAEEAGRQFVDSSNDAAMLNAFAWTILTDVPEAKRDLELARQAAAKAVELSEEKNPAILDTCALALYELGRQYVGQAVALQKKAVSLTEDEQRRAGLEKALQRYESASVQ